MINTYFTHIYIYFMVGGSLAIYRIVIDDLYIAYDPPNDIYGFLTSLCPYESLWTRMATLMSPLRLLQLYTRESMWRACDLVVLRSLLPTRTDTDNKVFRWAHIRPGRQFLRLGRPIVPIGVIQTLIDTIGPIHNPWFHRSHVRKWVPYEAIFAHRPMEGVSNIVSFDNDMIVTAIDFLTITPTNEDKKRNHSSDSHIDCQDRHTLTTSWVLWLIVTHYGPTQGLYTLSTSS